jgi:hypothetical protein
MERFPGVEITSSLPANDNMLVIRVRVLNKLFTKFVALIFLLLITTNCTSGTKPEEVSDSLVDKSFITGEPCTAPCWYELKVDETTEDDVLEKVRDVQFIDFVSRFDETIIWGNDKTAHKIHFDCLYDSQRY